MIIANREILTQLTLLPLTKYKTTKNNNCLKFGNNFLVLNNCRKLKQFINNSPYHCFGKIHKLTFTLQHYRHEDYRDSS